MKRNPALALGVVATLAATLLWHGPGGAGARFEQSINRAERAMLDHAEMQAVDGRLQVAPLTRRMILKGPGDDFQRSELVRLSEDIPGVAHAKWVDSRNDGRQPPLLVEIAAMALACFAAGVIIAYVAALRRRAKDAHLA